MACRKQMRTNPAVTPYYPGLYYSENSFVSYLSNFFKFYRGDLVYKFRLVKTIYHSGRFMIMVVPGATITTPLASIDFSKVHKTVYDIRETNEFEVVVPYKWNTPWKEVDGEFGIHVDGSELTPNIPTAMIYVIVLNSLRNPTTTANTIDIIVETSAASNFQFAFPRSERSTLLVSSEEQLRTDFPATPARGPAHANVQGLLESAPNDQLSANLISMGEMITGWRQLLKRYSHYLVPSHIGNQFQVLPYFTAQETSTKDAFDLYSACEILYRYVSGSLRIAPTAFTISTHLVITHSIQAHDDHEPRNTTAPTVLQSPILEPVVELGIPFYQETPAIPTHVGLPRQSVSTKLNTNFSEVPFNEGTALYSSTDANIWRSTGEDFSFGYLVGPPATLIKFEIEPQVPCNQEWKSRLTTWRTQMTALMRAGNFRPIPRTSTVAQLTSATNDMVTAVIGATPPVGVTAITTELAAALNVYLNAPVAEARALTDSIPGTYYQRYFNEFDNVCLPASSLNGGSVRSQSVQSVQLTPSESSL
jgi:hypothetical protein